MISCVDQVPLMGALFETSSAIGTVGLSLGLTPQLESCFPDMILILLIVLGKGRWVDTDFCGCIWTPFYEIKITTGKK